MFGYIAPRLDQLNDEQKRRYRSVYCGLCQALGTLSGRSGRLLLSHDMTFLALLLGSLTEPEETEKEIRCAVHPAKKRPVLQSRAVEYAAAMNLILMDQKCADSVRDDHSRAAAAERRWLKPAVEKLAERYPRETREIREALDALWQEEQAAAPDPDRLCNLSGKMLGAVFTPDWADPIWKNALRELGEGLGRFVYWMDAWDDLKEDRKKGRFNPLNRMAESEDPESFTLEVLEMFIGEAVSWFEALPLEKDLDLLRNVLYSGVWQRYYAMRNRREKEEKKA